MPELTTANWIQFIYYAITGVFASAGILWAISLWKGNKDSTDKEQSKTLKDHGERLKSAEASYKEITKSLAGLGSSIKLQSQQIDSLKKESKVTEHTLVEIQKSLKTIDLILGKIDSLEKATIAALASFEKLFEEKLKTVRAEAKPHTVVKRITQVSKSTNAKVQK